VLQESELKSCEMGVMLLDFERISQLFLATVVGKLGEMGQEVRGGIMQREGLRRPGSYTGVPMN
jgi:hypothetical protein